MNVSYRQGNKGDCHRIAELDYIASDGAVEYLFHDLVPDKSALQLLSDGLEQDVYPHTFRSCIVAEFDQKIIGMALSYPAHFHCITDELTNFLPANRLEKFHEFYSARVEGSYFHLVRDEGDVKIFRNSTHACEQTTHCCGLVLRICVLYGQGYY